MRRISLVDCGAITAVGHDAVRTVASLRAGIEGFADLPFAGVSGIELKGAPVVGYAEGLLGYPRYEALALRALQPIIERIPVAERRLVTVIVGLPRRDRAGVPHGLAKALCLALAHRLGLDPSRVLSIEAGRASVFSALTHPGFLDDPQAYPIVGGVDVLTDPIALAELSAAGELKEEWDGYFPGEAAAFVRLSSRRMPGYWGRPASEIVGIGLANEPAAGTADDPVIGVGLTRALAAAAADAGIDDGRIGLRVNDMNGTRVAFEDDAMAYTRFYRTRNEAVLDVWHLGSYLGETGAAAGALELIWAGAAAELGLIGREPVMLSCSEATRRAAVVLMPPPTTTVATGHARGQVSLTRIELNPRPVREEVEVADPGLRVPGLDDLRRELATLDRDELASMVLVREGHLIDPDAPWGDIAGYEERMLASIDALAWTRDAAQPLAIALLASDDIEEVAAAILALGSGNVDEDTWQAIRAAFRPDDDERARAIGRHLALCPSPEIRRRLAATRFADHHGSEIIGVIEALARLDALTTEQITTLAEAGRTELLPTMLWAVGFTALKPAMGPVDALCRRATAELHPGDLLPYVQLGAQSLPFFPPERYLEEAPVITALASLRLGRSFVGGVPTAGTPTPELVLALGWSGEPAAIARLLPLLTADDDELASSAARALDLLLGGDRYEKLELPDEDAEPGDDTVTVVRLCRDPAVWKAAYEAIGSPETYRLRHGARWHLGSARAHLQRARPPAVQRTWACWEHAVCSGAGFPVDPHQLVAVQLAALAEPAMAKPKP
jgi:3-oxoacyl-[acyl-carrier-protein] synthase I